MAIYEPDERLDNESNAAVDALEFARLAAEVVAMIEHHRDELRTAMAELTALQRTVRSEIRDAVHQLDRIAAGLPADAVDPGSTAGGPSVEADPATVARRRGRRS